MTPVLRLLGERTGIPRRPLPLSRLVDLLAIMDYLASWSAVRSQARRQEVEERVTIRRGEEWETMA